MGQTRLQAQKLLLLWMLLPLLQWVFWPALPDGHDSQLLLSMQADIRDAGSLGWGDPLEEGWQPTPVFLPGESHGQRSLVGYCPWGGKESATTEVI